MWRPPCGAWADSAHRIQVIRLGLLGIRGVAPAGVPGEVFTLIAQRLERESRFHHTVMVTHANGSCGYIPNDAAFEPAKL